MARLEVRDVAEDAPQARDVDRGVDGRQAVDQRRRRRVEVAEAVGRDALVLVRVRGRRAVAAAAARCRASSFARDHAPDALGSPPKRPRSYRFRLAAENASRAPPPGAWSRPLMSGICRV